MKTSRIAPVSMVLVVLLVATAGAATFDYTTLWTHLADTELDRFLYDCGGAVDVAVKGNFAYVVDSHAGLQVVDCTDPTSIVYRGFVSVPRPEGCAVRDHFVYVVTHGEEIAVVDVDEHDLPVVVNQVPAGGSPHGVAVNGPWLYVLTDDDTLRIFSLAAASNPAPVGNISLPAGRSDRLDLDGGRMYVAGHGGLAIYDVTVPEWPALQGTHDFTGEVGGLDVRDGLALVGQDPLSRLLDVTDPANVVERAVLDSEGNGALLTSNGQAWLGWGFCWHWSGMNVFDVTEPTAPVLVHQVIEGFRGWPQAMEEFQGHVFAPEYMCWCAGEWPGFHVFKPGEFPLPDPLAAWTRDGAFGLLRRGQRIQVATRAGIETWKLYDPAAPELVDTLEEESVFYHLAEDDGLIATCRLVPTAFCWLRLIERGSQGQLVSRGEVPVGYYPKAITISAALALLAYNDGGGIVVVDAADPDLPFVAADLLAGHTVHGVALQGRLAAVSTESDLLILDLTDPGQPSILATVPHGQYWRRECLAFTERDGHLLLTGARNWWYNYDGGFAEVFDLTDPSNPELLVAQRQLAMMDVGEVVWRDDLLVVAGSTHLTFYRWTDVDAPVEFAGRVLVREDPPGRNLAPVVVTDAAVATLWFDGAVQTWPLPEGLVTAAPDPVPRPAELEAEAVPNPFNPNCEIRFALPAISPVTVEIFDLRGRRLRELRAGVLTAGDHAMSWDGTDQAGRPLATGAYVAVVRAAQERRSVKLMLVR